MLTGGCRSALGRRSRSCWRRSAPSRCPQRTWSALILSRPMRSMRRSSPGSTRAVGPIVSELRLGLDSVVMDTDVASLFYKEQLQPALTAKLFGRHKVLPFVTVGELTKWTEVRSWGEGRVESLRRWLDASAIISGDEAVASLLGRNQA